MLKQGSNLIDYACISLVFNNIKGDYSNVLFWANKLAYVPSISIVEWSSLLNPQDYEELREYFTNCDIDREATSDVWHDYLTRPCD